MRQREHHIHLRESELVSGKSWKELAAKEQRAWNSMNEPLSTACTITCMFAISPCVEQTMRSVARSARSRGSDTDAIRTPTCVVTRATCVPGGTTFSRRTPFTGSGCVVWPRRLAREQMSSSDYSLATESFWRYSTLDEMLHQHNGGWSEDTMKAASACVSVQQMFERLGASPANRSIPANMLSRTLWHSLYNVEQGTVAVDFYLGETSNGDTTNEIRSGYYEFALSQNELRSTTAS